MDKQIVTHPYANVPSKLQIAPIEKWVGEVNDKGLVYEMGLTPQLIDEPEWCIFSLNIIKESVNGLGESLVKYSVQSGYKIKAKGSTLTPEFLFQLQKMSYLGFRDLYTKESKNTLAEVRIIDEPKLSDYKQYLKTVIVGQGISKQ